MLLPRWLTRVSLVKPSNFAYALARDLGADEGELLQVLQARELFHAGIGELAVVGEAERFEIRELRDVRHPRVVELGRDDVQRLQRRDVPQMLEEGRVVRIVLPMVMRPRPGHGEIDELQALTVFSLFHFALCRLRPCE